MPNPLGEARLLVVDDQVEQVESLKLLLEPLGYRVETSLNVGAALLLADAHPPDALVLDWLLPGGGVAFIESLRAKLGKPYLPVLVVTGLPLEQAHEAESLPDVTLLQKPYTPERLLAWLGDNVAG